ncbi:MAG: shikimate dehydrogenase [Candidatus Omnitrophota bacterium]|jgi:shikimate dehydrogenase
MSVPETYGLLGYPVKHSVSPAMHNAAFQALRINAKYKLFEVQPELLSSFLQSTAKENIRGFNVTIPYKETMVNYVDQLSEEARIIGAVNTVKVVAGSTMGHNTDALGFLKHLMDIYPKSLYNQAVSVIGAGGAARAVVQSLAAEGAGKILIYDIQKEKAESIVNKITENFEVFNIEVVDTIDMLLESVPDLLINSSPVGMNEFDPLLVNVNKLSPSTFVYDLIYNPQQTKLLQLARTKGCRYSNGLGMLLYQGMLSFEYWTGLKPPVEVMRKALVDEIAKHK